MSASSFSSISTTHGACRTEFKRQKTYLTLEKQYIIDNESTDPLPIVELKPFVKKVWRREKSLPSFYDMLPPSKPLTTKSKKAEQIFPQDPPPLEKIELYIGNGVNENKTESKARHTSGHLSPRCKSKNLIHPSAETKAPKQIEHTQSLVPGFISRDERSKTTLNEIQHSDSPTKIQTGLMSSLERKEVDEPSMFINLRGDSFKPNGSVRRPLSYFVPHRNSMKKNGMWQQLQSTDSLPNYITRHMMSRSPLSDDTSRSSSPYYDSFDKRGTLPSIKISYQTLAKRPNKPKIDSDDYNTSPYHQVSRINNALYELSKYGAASKIERQLSFQLKIDLHKFRKSRDYFPFDITPNELAKYYPPPAINLTNGEIHIRKAQQLNTPMKRRKEHRQKSQVSFHSTSDKIENQEWGPSRTEDDRPIDTRNTNLESALENIAESESEEEELKLKEITVPSQFDNVTNTQESDSALRGLDDSRTGFTQPTQPTKSTIDIGLQSTFQSNMAEATSTQEMDVEPHEQNERSALSTRTSGIISGVRDANISFLNASDIQKDSESREAKSGNIDKLERDSTFLTSDLNTDYGNPDLSVVS